MYKIVVENCADILFHSCNGNNLGYICISCHATEHYGTFCQLIRRDKLFLVCFFIWRDFILHNWKYVKPSYEPVWFHFGTTARTLIFILCQSLFPNQKPNYQNELIHRLTAERCGQSNSGRRRWSDTGHLGWGVVEKEIVVRMGRYRRNPFISDWRASRLIVSEFNYVSCDRKRENITV